MPPRKKSRVELTAPRAKDRDEFLKLIRASRSLHRPWVYPPCTARDFARYLRVSGTDDRASFFVRSSETGELVSVVELSVITGGVEPDDMGPAAEAEVMRIVDAFDANEAAAPGDAVSDRAAEFVEDREEILEEAPPGEGVIG